MALRFRRIYSLYNEEEDIGSNPIRLAEKAINPVA